MQGPGYAPPPPQPPSTGVLVVLRVIFVAVALLSIGFLAWVAPLRAAIVTRRRAEWGFFAGTLVVLGISFALLSTDHTDDFSTPNGNAGMIILLLNAVACVGYFLYADIRHFHRLRQAYVARMPLAPGYGYPQPAPPFAATTGPSMPQPPYAPAPMPHPSAPHPSAPQPPVPAPPQRPAPARINQVRAELDELSDYLRKQDGRPGSGEGGR
ncbi:hypothetical protein AB0L59_25465 [Streptomyces sp. NPDC052109]|uniref:hypothetical protein n=1 Tax=Streptomyces sp. NPDC052109 TaxID=3155527 RepID=UPI00342C0407